MRHVVTCILLILIWFALILAVLCDQGDPSGSIFVIVALTAGFIVTFLPFPSRRRSLKDAMIATAIYIFFLGWVLVIRDSPFFRYNTAYLSIRVGMSLAEAEDVVRRELPYRASAVQGDLENGWVRFEPTNQNYNADQIDIFTFNGRVAQKLPIPD